MVVVQTRVCQICSKRPAKYVCLECGRIICEVCLEPQTWVCSDCYGYLEGESRRFWIFQSPFFRLLLLSFLLIFIGVVFILISVLMGTPVSAGVVVILGPIPIILGAGPYATLALALAVVLTILSIVMFFLFRRGRKRDHN